jgi:hypothetical protein
MQLSASVCRIEGAFTGCAGQPDQAIILGARPASQGTGTASRRATPGAGRFRASLTITCLFLCKLYRNSQFPVIFLCNMSKFQDLFDTGISV